MSVLIGCLLIKWVHTVLPKLHHRCMNVTLNREGVASRGFGGCLFSRSSFILISLSLYNYQILHTTHLNIPTYCSFVALLSKSNYHCLHLSSRMDQVKGVLTLQGEALTQAVSDFH